MNIRRLLCWLGIHKFDPRELEVEFDEETGDAIKVRFFCVYCQREIKESGNFMDPRWVTQVDLLLAKTGHSLIAKHKKA